MSALAPVAIHRQGAAELLDLRTGMARRPAFVYAVALSNDPSIISPNLDATLT